MKIRKSMAVMVAFVLTAGTLLCACEKAGTFDGSKTGDADHFSLDFENLNTTYSHDIEMKVGESIDVSVECLKGKISITIQNGDKEPAYRGNDLGTTDFRVGINEEGTYTLTVSGEKAKGRVNLVRSESVQE